MGVKIEEQDAVRVGGILFVKYPTHVIRGTKITPYIQIGGADWELYNKSLYQRVRYSPHGSGAYTAGLDIGCYQEGDYQRAFFFYPSTVQHWLVISEILAQAPAGKCKTVTPHEGLCYDNKELSVYRSMAVQMPIALEGEEEPIMTLIVIHYKDDNQ